MKKKILLGFLAILVIMQFFRIDMDNPPVDPAKDFIALTEPSDEVKTLLKSACYDCHSNETEYPWYAHVAPVSWPIGHHIEEGREHLNFSIWADYDADKADHKLEECAGEVEEGHMPISSYTWTHGDAKLSKEQKETLEEFFEGLRK